MGTQKSRMTLAAAATPAEPEPRDVAPLRELDEQIRSFNGAALTRKSLTADDSAALAAIEDSVQRFLSASRDAWRGGGPGIAARREPASVQTLAADVSSYARICRSTQILALRDQGAEAGDPVTDVELPATESETVRQLLFSRGEKLLSDIATAIETAHARDRRAEAARIEYVRKIEFWIADPVTGPICRAIVAASTDPRPMFDTRGESAIFMLGPLTTALHDLASRIWRADASATPAPLFTGQQSDWMPILIERVTAMQSGSKEAA